MSSPQDEPPKPYSKAFDNIVQDEDDVVGLLAYALYKRAVREEAEAGRKSDGSHRNPPPTVVQTYRAAAERTLSEVISDNLEAAKPELQLSAALDGVNSARSDLREHVTNRTGFLHAIITNVVAWVLTLFITVMLLLTFGRDDPAEAIKRQAEKAVPAATTALPAPK